MTRPLPIAESCRADLYAGLAHALGAGLSPAVTLEAVSDVCGGALATALARARSAVANGTALAAALERHGLLPALDYALLGAVEKAGRIEHAFEQLAERCEHNHARWRAMRGRLLLPAAILVLAILLLPIPALFAGRISAVDYALRALAMLALFALAVHGARRLAVHWRCHGPPSLVTRTARRLPIAQRLSRLHERAAVAEALALSLSSGVPALEALGNLVQATGNSVHRANLMRASAKLRAGTPLADALMAAGLLDAREGYAIVSAAEQAGRLDSAIGRYARSCNGVLDDVYDLLAQWLPVIAYLAVAGVVAAGLLG